MGRIAADTLSVVCWRLQRFVRQYAAADHAGCANRFAKGSRCNLLLHLLACGSEHCHATRPKLRSYLWRRAVQTPADIRLPYCSAAERQAIPWMGGRVSDVAAFSGEHAAAGATGAVHLSLYGSRRCRCAVADATASRGARCRRAQCRAFERGREHVAGAGHQILHARCIRTPDGRAQQAACTAKAAVNDGGYVPSHLPRALNDRALRGPLCRTSGTDSSGGGN
mmetsp:Transcript_26075/g.84159  ORF Transcript_26075/g.84159 Transcript_26075/m.84159 type:complete len:224 (+) Transcript_26075:1346-2017(+)